MKKFIFTAVIIAASSLFSNAEDYNRISLTYSNTRYSFNKYFTGGSDNNFTTNGGGVAYTHGFNLSKRYPIFLETGINADFNFGSLTLKQSYEEVEYWLRVNANQKQQFIYLQVPLNFVFQYHATNNFTISPYAGFNMKLNVIGRFRTGYDISTNLPLDILSEYGIYGQDLKQEGEWQNIYDRNDMGSNDNTYNRFQVGWQVGVGFGYKHAYLGIQYGTDFIPAFKYEEYRVNCGTFRLTLGYTI